MTKNILIGGAAGLGSAVTSHIIGKIFCSLGYYVFNYRDYPSLIRGGNNFNVLKISDKPVYSHELEYDLILALDQKTIDLHQKNLKKGGLIFGDKNFKAKNLYPIAVKDILSELEAPKIIENDILIGCLFKYFGVGLPALLKEIEKEFQNKSEIIKRAVKRGYEAVETKERIKKIGPARYFISGNEAVGTGSLAAGMDVHIAYPMTPASPVLHFLAKKQLEYNTLVFQPENEIAAINMALGASYAGARVLVGTSGGGFALMAEAFSLAGMAELPLVVYEAQRTGPSTGVATYTGQGDLKFALNAGHGEFPRIVLAPGDAQEAIVRSQEAFYLAAKYRTPVIILGDKHLGESDYSFDDLKKSRISNKRFILDNPPKDHKSYKITQSGVSPAAVPGQVPNVYASSYEHDEYGHTVEDAETIVKMNDKRLKKAKYIKEEVKKLNPVSVYGKGEKLIIGWGSTKGAIIDSLPQLKGYRFMQVSYFSPFPAEKVALEIKKSSQSVLVENSATGQLGDLIAEQTGIKIKNKILKYDARPFTVNSLIKEMKKI